MVVQRKQLDKNIVVDRVQCEPEKLKANSKRGHLDTHFVTQTGSMMQTGFVGCVIPVIFIELTISEGCIV